MGRKTPSRLHLSRHSKGKPSRNTPYSTQHIHQDQQDLVKPIARHPGDLLTPQSILRLQRAIGNRATQHILHRAHTQQYKDREPLVHTEIVPKTSTQVPGGIVQRYWDVACKPKKVDNTWYISNIVIKNRPPNPETGNMVQHGGNSFHHESAWNFVERQVLQFAGQPLIWVANYLMKYGLPGSGWPKMPAPSDQDQLSLLEAINEYFHVFLSAKASEASGWLGPKGTHASQGGKISSALKTLKSQGFSKENIVKALTVSFEPEPTLQGEDLSDAAEDHADMFYAAFQLFLEENNDISVQDHEQVLEDIKDWTNQYWVEPVDF